jgi:lipid-A-disaccharide synthase
MSNLGGIKLAVIAGEVSGDHLAADLVHEIKFQLKKTDTALELIGVGGEGLEEEGLTSFFDYSELSLIGIGAVLKQLPKLLMRINQTAKAIISQQPDVLIIVDSPDFTHRVAKKVHEELPDLPIINYVCPTVWAWKSERAEKMRAYVNHVLSVFPFEPEVVAKLNGPPLTYIGHRLVENKQLNKARAAQKKRKLTDQAKTFLLLPGSRNSEIMRLIDVMGDAAEELAIQYPTAKFVIPTLERFRAKIEDETKAWSVDVDIVTGEANKWKAFAEADAALAASGTILLELALAGVPCISIYKTDILLRMLSYKIKTWSAALPNLIAGYPVIPEYIDHMLRPSALARKLNRLASPTLEREAMLEAFGLVHQKMKVDRAPSVMGAEIVISHIKKDAK